MIISTRLVLCSLKRPGTPDANKYKVGSPASPWVTASGTNDAASSLQVTGLYAESHGIVSSYMYDPLSHKHFNLLKDTDPMWWSQAEPLWITARRYGYKTATAMWPGSDAINRTGTYFLPYNQRVTFRERLGSLLRWIQGSEEVKGESTRARS